MKLFVFLFSLLSTLLFIGCKSKSASTDTQESVSNDSMAIQQQQAEISPAGDVKELANFTGKKPSEVDMFSKYLPDARMKALLGVEFPDFKLDWNEETVIEKDAELVYFSGCRKNACSDNSYLVIVDLTTNQVNVMNFKGEAARTYEEGGVIIGLTDKLADEVKRLKRKK